MGKRDSERIPPVIRRSFIEPDQTHVTMAQTSLAPPAIRSDIQCYR